MGIAWEHALALAYTTQAALSLTQIRASGFQLENFPIKKLHAMFFGHGTGALHNLLQVLNLLAYFPKTQFCHKNRP